MNEERDICIGKAIAITAVTLVLVGVAAKGVKKLIEDKKRYARIKYLYTKEF
jgi:hypothetical protein